MGTGKTVVAKILSQRLKREFVEMDEVIEKETGKPIAKIFAEDGEPHFRTLEKKLLRELAQRSDLIVSCGGGLICDEENFKLLKESGAIFNLRARPQTIYQRTKDKDIRPLLNVRDPLEKIKDLLKQRKPFYEKADYSLDTDEDTPEEVADKITQLLK